VPGFEADPTAIFPITVYVSALVSGALARFRILSTNVGEQTVVSNPGATRFEPGATGPNSFSYQWVERDDVAPPHANLIRLQWRSPSGDQVSMRRGDMTVLYRMTRTSPGPGSGVGTSTTTAGAPSFANPNAFILPPSPRAGRSPIRQAAARGGSGTPPRRSTHDRQIRFGA